MKVEWRVESGMARSEWRSHNVQGLKPEELSNLFVLAPSFIAAGIFAAHRPEPAIPDSSLAVFFLKVTARSLHFAATPVNFWPGLSLPTPSRRGYFPKIWVGVCGALLEALTLFQTKICDFPYPISDLTQTLIPYLRPEPNPISFA